ncbi:MAG: protein kinase [Myxococcota bacterium]
MSGRSQYRFLRRIATGGMAELYLGESIGVGDVTKRVALKRMLPAHAGDQEFMAMFLDEARLASTLQHPNIVQTYDVIQSGSELVMVMEFLEGADLQQFRRQAHAKGEVLTLDQVLYVVRGVLSGLHYAHDRARPDGRNLQGIVHRDVSPQNVYLTYDGGVKLLDFGIAKSTQMNAPTDSGVLKGKVLYMAPEQCGGGSIDRRTDIYALGVVFYQLLTGTVPHRGKNAYDTMRSIIDDPVPDPRRINPRLSPELERIVLRALQKRPQDRYPTARAMLEDIEKFAQDHSLFVSTVGFSNLVEAVLGPRPRLDAAELAASDPSMPQAIEVETPVRELTEVPVPTPPVVLAPIDTEHATLRRESGVAVVTLHGVLDERFDPAPLIDAIRGEVVIDTHDVSRITSYGIRSLIGLLGQARANVQNLYFVRCSVPFVNQVTMIRGLLGGGKILSFQAPFIDPITGSAFTEVLSGETAERAVLHHELPVVPSPSDPSRAAEFDDDPRLYFHFAEDFLPVPPEHIRTVLSQVEARARKLDVELTVDGHVSTLYIRRPLRSDARWGRVVRGLEGVVKLDLSECATTTKSGIAAFVDAFDRISPEIVALELVGTPIAVCDALSQRPSLRGVLRVVSLQVAATCKSCGLSRQQIVDLGSLRGRSPVIFRAGCTRCGGDLVIESDLSGFELMSLSMPDHSHHASDPGPAERRGCLAAFFPGPRRG